MDVEDRVYKLKGDQLSAFICLLLHPWEGVKYCFDLSVCESTFPNSAVNGAMRVKCLPSLIALFEMDLIPVIP